jgi:hypothetical protein
MDKPAWQFIGEEIVIHFNKPPALLKTPPCPDSFTWQGRTYRVVEKLSEWHDFTRRGRMARNMRPAHASVAARRGSLGVGRFFFRVRTETGQFFELYYDRTIRDVNDRLGHWFLYRKMIAGD